MPALHICAWAALLGCCAGFVIPQQPAQYYDYDVVPYQWQPQTYQIQYQPYDYEPSYYSTYYSGYYYFPYAYANPEFHKNDLHKPFQDHGLSYYEAEKLLQLYRIIRVVSIFRTPPKKPKKITSLDVLLHRLTKQKLQKQLVELVNHLHGYKEVAELTRGHPEHSSDGFVNDNARLLTVIQRALNTLNLDAYDHDPYHQKGYGFCERHKELCVELRRLRDQANALTVAQIEKEMFEGYKPEMKQDPEDLAEDLESRDLDNLEVDDNEEAMPGADQYVEVEALKEFIIGLELYLQQQKIAEEQNQLAVDQLNSMTSTTSSPVPVTSAEGSWFGSMFGKGNVATDNQTTDASKPMKETNNKPNEQNAWVHEDGVGKNPHDFDIDERFQTATNTKDTGTASTVTHSVPLWLTKNTEQPESKELVPDVLTSKEIEIIDQLPESRQDPEDVAQNPVEEKHQQPEVTTEDATPSSSTNINDQSSSSTTTAATTPRDARSFVKEQVLNVLRLLEEAKGFTEIKEHISNPDVDQLVNGLTDVEAGVRWTEILSALQNMVVDKQLDRTEQIVNVLEHWKKGAKGQLDNGYFNRTYGASQDVEARGLVDDEEASMRPIQGEDTAKTVIEHTPFVDDVDNFFDGTYGLDNKTSNETRAQTNVTDGQIANNASAGFATDDRGPRIINVDETPTVSIPTAVEETSITEASKQQEEKIPVTAGGSTTARPLSATDSWH